MASIEVTLTEAQAVELAARILDQLVFNNSHPTFEKAVHLVIDESKGGYVVKAG